MITEALEAWVLHKCPSGDTSARVTFFTREKGIMNCLCKGGRRPKKQAILQLFVPLWLAVDVRKDWYFVRHIETVAGAFALYGNSLFAGLYMNELLYYALSPMDSQAELFDAYLHAMQGLATTTDKLAIEILLRHFEWALLLACGYPISFKEMPTSLPIDANRYYQFIAGEGFIAADQGMLGRDILALEQGRLEDVRVLKVAKLIMRQAIDHLLDGRELKSRSFARSIALMGRRRQQGSS